ncbi:MAG TPA: hypothetical protein VMW65_12765 [Chloroflexota bacterium]|nr:hypothetical protein [Chloroflexota bacterium]
MSTPGGTLGAEFERRFYPFADVVLRLANTEPGERAKAIQEVYGRHIGYILALLNEMAEDGDFAGWLAEKRSPNVEQQIQNRAKQHLNEKQAKQTYR